jgi:zinc transporter ZupT
MYLGIYFAVILSIIHFISEYFANFTKKHIMKIMSLAAGILLSILFLEMLPIFTNLVKDTDPLLFLFPLMGFVGFHSIRAYNFKHIKTKKELKARFRKNHIIAFFIEHFILGFMLTLTFRTPLVSILLFLPFILLTVSSSVLLKIIDKTSKTAMPKLILGSSTLLGALVGTFFSFHKVLFAAAFGYALGSLLYIVSRDIMPQEEKKENLTFFSIGLASTTILLIVIQTFF